MGLAQERVDKRGLAMVNVCDNGDIPNIVTTVVWRANLRHGPCLYL
jgi:hypothetical protein